MPPHHPLIHLTDAKVPARTLPCIGRACRFPQHRHQTCFADLRTTENHSNRLSFTKSLSIMMPLAKAVRLGAR